MAAQLSFRSEWTLANTPKQKSKELAKLKVRGPEAFAAEGCPGFESSPDYLRNQVEEYERSKKGKTPFAGSFADW